MYRLQWFFSFVFLTFFVVTISSKDIKAMTFNVQNLFDGKNDGTEYQEYSPPRWNNTQYHYRLSAVGKAVQKLAFSLDIIALQEVENERVVKDLQKYYLPRLSYVAVSTAKKSAVQIALLSRYKILEVKEHQVQIPSLSGGLRPILEVTLELSSKKKQTQHAVNTIQVFVVHLKSKRSSNATISSSQIRSFQYTLIINNFDTTMPTVLLGDFNDEEAYTHLQHAYHQKYQQSIESLVDTKPYYDTEAVVNGTYYYKGWAQLDHIFFDTSFATIFSEIELTIVGNAPFTIVSSKQGITPNKFYMHFKNYTAVSDHLPVLLTAQYK